MTDSSLWQHIVVDIISSELPTLQGKYIFVKTMNEQNSFPEFQHCINRNIFMKYDIKLMKWQLVDINCNKVFYDADSQDTIPPTTGWKIATLETTRIPIFTLQWINPWFSTQSNENKGMICAQETCQETIKVLIVERAGIDEVNGRYSVQGKKNSAWLLAHHKNNIWIMQIYNDEENGEAIWAFRGIRNAQCFEYYVVLSSTKDTLPPHCGWEAAQSECAIYPSPGIQYYYMNGIHKSSSVSAEPNLKPRKKRRKKQKKMNSMFDQKIVSKQFKTKKKKKKIKIKTATKMDKKPKRKKGIMKQRINIADEKRAHPSAKEKKNAMSKVPTNQTARHNDLQRNLNKLLHKHHERKKKKQLKKMSKSGFEIRYNYRYKLDDGRIGVCKYKGTTEFGKSSEYWIGLMIQVGSGENDGSVQGKVYFRCKDGKGLFVRPYDIVQDMGSQNKLLTKHDVELAEQDIKRNKAPGGYSER